MSRSIIVEAFRRRGVTLETLEVRNAPPLIVGDLKVPGATRTIGIYVHYDGQPVQAPAWTATAPWARICSTIALTACWRPTASSWDLRPILPA